MKLYEISAAFQAAIESAVDPETGELRDIDALREQLGDKLEAVAAYVLNTEAEIVAQKSVIDRIERAMRANASKAQRMREYMAHHMAATGVTSIKAGDGSFSVKLEKGRDSSVVVNDVSALPPEFLKHPAPTADKARIRQELAAGRAVSGATLMFNDRLTIR